MSTRYGGERIKRGLLHFALGKGISALAGIFAMLLVIRELSVEAFAAYSVLVALVEMLTAISGLGLAHALLRYVPELYSRHYQVSLRNFVYGALGLRTSLLLLAALVAYVFSDKLAPQIGLGNAIMAFQAFLVVVLLRSTTHFLSQILESTLHQGLVQIGFTVATLVRLLGMLYLLQGGGVQLVDVIWVEAIGDALSLFIMLVGVVRVVTTTETESVAPEDDGGWLRRHLRQIAKFALAGYVQHLAITPYGGHTNRLVGGGMLSVGAMAAYGFAQSLYEYMKRYMPAQMLVGLIRPVVVARYCERRDFWVAAKMCGQVLQINILLIVGMFGVLMVGGGEMLSAISAGKYGAEALLILVALFIVLLLETQRQQLELLVQTVERYQFLISTNVLLASSVILAVALLPMLGAVAFPAANALGLLAANAWVQRQMKSADFHFNHDWFSTLRILLLCVAAVGVGEVSKLLGLPWYLATAITMLVYALLVFVVCGGVVRNFVQDLTGKRKTPLPDLGEASVAPIKIVFGVLSSKQSSGAIDEIAAAVYPHPVYVHHDFSKQPDFSPGSANIRVLSNPVTTAWGDWSLVEASYRLMQAAMEDPAMTHFQLLSEACLPVRPIRDFETYLSSEQPDVMIDILSLEDEDALFSHGWRYCQRTSLSLRIVRRASVWIWGKPVSYRPVCSVNLRLGNPADGLVSRVKSILGRLILHGYARSAQELLARNGLSHFAIGGQWFGASRRAVMWLLQARNVCVTFTRHYQRCHIPDESYLHTLLLNAQHAGVPLRVYPSNHALFWDECGTGPDMLKPQDIGRVRASGKFFSRKFSLSVADPVRHSFTTATL